ncbi:MAG: methylglyoxal synthase [Cyclobacteriaceae bacterium]
MSSQDTALKASLSSDFHEAESDSYKYFYSSPANFILLPIKLNDMEMKQAVALVAHDNKKPDLLNWVREHIELLSGYELYATGTTGKLLEEGLKDIRPVSIHKLLSGPLGGDQQIGAKIAEGDIDFLIFFWDPLEPQPHDPDVKALLRIAVTWDIPFACNRASANFLFASAQITKEFRRQPPDFQSYLNREVRK